MAGFPKRGVRRAPPSLMHVRMVQAFENVRGQVAKMHPADADDAETEITMVLALIAGECKKWRANQYIDGDQVMAVMPKGAILEAVGYGEDADESEGAYVKDAGASRAGTYAYEQDVEAPFEYGVDGDRRDG